LLDGDSTYAEFVFREVVQEILAGHWGVASKKDVAEFAMLFMYEAQGKFPSSQVNLALVDDFIPVTWREEYPATVWVALMSYATLWLAIAHSPPPPAPSNPMFNLTRNENTSYYNN